MRETLMQLGFLIASMMIAIGVGMQVGDNARYAKEEKLKCKHTDYDQEPVYDENNKVVFYKRVCKYCKTRFTFKPISSYPNRRKTSTKAK